MADGEYDDDVLAGEQPNLQERVAVGVEVTGDREALGGRDYLAVDLEPHLPVLNPGEGAEIEGVTPVNAVQAGLRQDDVLEGHRAQGGVGHVDDPMTRGKG